MKIIWGFSFFLVLISFSVFAKSEHKKSKSNVTPVPLVNTGHICDTLYTLQPFYVEVNLNTQTGFIHYRDGNTTSFGISSGTDRLEKGINTKEGLFVIQSKLPKWYSKQFDNTLMLNWMGFNFGIGFHALQTSGYYRHLGRNRSSHGCVRISRATAQLLFDTIKLGTPVLVHKGTTLLTVAFADSTDRNVHYSRKQLLNEVELKEKLIRTGRYYLHGRKVIIDKNNVGQSGLALGNPVNISHKPLIKSPLVFIQSVIPHAKGIVVIPVKSIWKSYNMHMAWL